MKNVAHILVPTDFSRHSETALKYALGLAEKLEAKITLAHAHDVSPYAYEGQYWLYEETRRSARTALNEAVAQAKRRYANVHGLFLEGAPRREIVAAAGDLEVDLIVMGTHGRRGVRYALLGSVAEKVVRTASVPVLTVPTPKAIEKVAPQGVAE